MTTSYTDLIKNLTAQDERRDRIEMSRESEPSPVSTVPAGVDVLMRHAGEVDYSVTPTPTYLSEQNLEVQGCQFVDATNFFLTYLDCPAKVRPIITAIVGLSGGDYLNYVEITQKQIAERLGISDVKIVRDGLHQLYQWEQQNDRACVQVEEQDRAGGDVKYGTTRYRAIVVFYAAEFIRRLRARGLRPVHQQRKLTGKIEELMGQVADDGEEELRASVAGEVADEMPNADIKRRQPKEKKAAQRKMNFIEGHRFKVLKAILAWRKAHVESGYDPSDAAAELYGEIDEVVRTGRIPGPYPGV